MTRIGVPSRAKIFAGHLSVGLVFGTLLGVIYFGVDPLRVFWGRYEYLGASLARVLEVYLLFGLVLGGMFGLAFGALGALVRRWAEPERYVAFYVGLLAFVLIVAYTTRNYSVRGILSIPVSSHGVWFLLALAGSMGLGYLLSNVLVRSRAFRRFGIPQTAALVVVCLFAVVVVHALADRQEGYLPPNRAAPDFEGPNVILIVLDAFRPDHVSAYGYDRKTTPTMDRLSGEGVLFENAHSHGNRTIISMPAVFTSLYPSFHGAIGRGTLMRPLGFEHTTMAEVFQKRGYTTVGLMNNVYLKSKFGLVRGFTRVEEYHFDRFHLGVYKTLRHLGVIERPKYVVNVYPDADEVTDAAIRWVQRFKSRPYFMYVHYMDTHHPYAPPPPYDTVFGSGTVGHSPMELYKKTTHMIRYGPSIELDDVELAKLKDYYDGSIMFADHEIGRLLAEVERFSQGRETIVVVTADHGDEFLEHGSLYHTNLVYEELIHVPLIVWSSERFTRGARIRPLVRHIDLLPTLAELIGADVPAQAMGRSLVPLLEGKTDSFDVESFAEGDFCTSLNRGSWKIMRVDSTDSYHLFDLSRRPREKWDLSGLRRDVYSQMHAQLLEYIERAGEVKKEWEAEADEDTIRELKALGYL